MGTNASHIEWLEIDYPALVQNPKPAIASLLSFSEANVA